MFSRATAKDETSSCRGYIRTMMLLKITLHDLGLLEFHSVQRISNSALIEVLQIIAGECQHLGLS